MKWPFQASIHARLLVAASLVLGAFLGLTGLALDKAFRSSAEEALKARLQSSVYAILAAAEEGGDGRMNLPKILTDPRFNMPDSGLYASVIAPKLGFHWRSASSVGLSLSYLQMVGPGQSHFQLAETPKVGKLMTLSFGVVWEDFAGNEISYVLAVAEDLDCSGLPASDETICTYDEGFLSGLLSEYTGKRFKAEEVDCWCSGDRVCRFDVRPAA